MDLSHTVLNIESIGISEEAVGKRMMIISSTQKIKGIPKINKLFYNNIKEVYDVVCKKEEHKVYLVIVFKKR